MTYFDLWYKLDETGNREALLQQFEVNGVNESVVNAYLDGNIPIEDVIEFTLEEVYA